MARPRLRRGFGTIRQLPSGRHQASYIGPDGARHKAPDTFDTYGDAEQWLAAVQTDISRDEWQPRDPKPRPGTFTAYSDSWLDTRRLTPKTRQEYRKLLDGHLLPTFGTDPLDTITPLRVRQWHAGLDTGPTRMAHAYALLRAILNTAVADDAIDSNPCRVRGAGQATRVRDIRPASPAELEAIADAMRPGYRAAVLIAGWCGLRFGEIAELRRGDVDLKHNRLRIRRAVTHADGQNVVGEPKSVAGRRDVAIPAGLVPVLEAHLTRHAQPGANGLLFPSPGGEHLRTDGALHRDFKAAAAAAGRPDLRWHDLRHTGATMATHAGATLAEVMHRLGHSTAKAAMRYQHATAERDAEIAAALDGFREARVVELRPRQASARAARS